MYISYKNPELMDLKQILLTIVLCVNILFFYIIFIKNPNVKRTFSTNSTIESKTACRLTKTSTKIAWYQIPRWLPSSFNFCHCNFTNCELTVVKNKKTDIYDAIIFHHRYLPAVLPQKPKGQIWIIWTAESPANEKPLPAKWHQLFDWSATYRRDSEIYIQRMIIPREKRVDKNYSEIFRRKRKFAAWVVSNCKTPSKRQKYVKEMQKYINVDVYGKCGKQDNVCAKKSISECFIHLSKEYKFYLGFENSLCKDYFTEKVAFNFLDNNDMVYVVRGAPNLKHLIPEHTVILTEEFRSAKQLSEYLLKLGSNETEYVRYLQNKNKYQLIDNRRQRALCSLCDLLQTFKKRKLKWTGKHFNHWYSKGVCIKRPSDLQ